MAAVFAKKTLNQILFTQNKIFSHCQIGQELLFKYGLLYLSIYIIVFLNLIIVLEPRLV